MTTTLTEGRHAGEFLLSEANGQLSREAITVASGEDLVAGAVLGQVTASGKYVEYNPANADGSETAVAVLYDAVDATGGDADGVAIARQAEVASTKLTWFSGASSAQIDTGESELASNSDIIAR